MGCSSSKKADTTANPTSPTTSTETKKVPHDKFDPIVENAFDQIANGKITINFVPVWVANNAREGGLGIHLFHYSADFMEHDKLVGKVEITKKEFLAFYHKVAEHAEHLAEYNVREELHELEKCMKYIVSFYQTKGEDVIKRVTALVRFFDAMDKNKDNKISKDEMINFYQTVIAKDFSMDEDVIKATAKSEEETAFRWVDRDHNGTISLPELVSFAFAPSMLAKSYDEWVTALDAYEIKLNFVKE